MKNLLFLFLLLLLTSLSLHAQTDSLYSLVDCERSFLERNLNLLAAKYNVTAAQATVIQAGLWENPSLSVELNALNPDRKRFFDIGSNGDKAISIQQIIHIGGQKHNEAQLARANASIAQLEFADLLRNLKLTLRQSYFSIYYDNLSYQAIIKQMESLNRLIEEYELQVKLGNLSLKDLIRLKALYLDFHGKKTELYKTISENQSNLALLVGIDGIVPLPKADELTQYKIAELPPIEELYQKALRTRPDYLMGEMQVEAAALNEKWQKSLAVPDLTLGANYAQRGGAFYNQMTVSVGVPLVLWNRNQGAIRAAAAQTKVATASKDYLKVKVMQDIVLSHKKWTDALQNSMLVNEETMQSFKNVADAMFKNFEHGNVSLVEFTDFLESYNMSLLQYHLFGKAYVTACEELNFYSYSPIFNITGGGVRFK